jgi:hypothetical protein
VTSWEPADVGGRLAVTVTALSFRGPNLRCRARTVGGAELVVDIGPHAPTVPPRVGDAAWVSWPDGAATFVPGDVVPSDVVPSAIDVRAPAPPRPEERAETIPQPLIGRQH